METRSPKGRIDKFPKIGTSDKKAEAISGTTVLRRRRPTNVQTAMNHPNMVWDHSKQMRVFPDGKPGALIEATHATGQSLDAYRTMNRSGKPYALGVMVGGSPDDAGIRDINMKPGKKIIKG